jgi:hypothetical protein
VLRGAGFKPAGSGIFQMPACVAGVLPLSFFCAFCPLPSALDLLFSAFSFQRFSFLNE